MTEGAAVKSEDLSSLETENQAVEEALSDEDLFRIFVGSNVEKFLKLRQKMLDNKSPVSFNWAVFLISLPWFFYRKLYLWGLGILLIPVVVVIVFPSLSNASFTGLSVSLALFANSLYVWTVNRRIAKMRELDLSDQELKNRVEKKGGTSPAGAVFGVLVICAIIALVILGAGVT